MSARSDYPSPVAGRTYETMINELDNLRRWKAEAMVVITEWDECYDILAAAGHPAPFGLWKARHVAGYLKIAVDDDRVGR